MKSCPPGIPPVNGLAIIIKPKCPRTAGGSQKPPRLLVTVTSHPGHDSCQLRLTRGAEPAPARPLRCTAAIGLRGAACILLLFYQYLDCCSAF